MADAREPRGETPHTSFRLDPIHRLLLTRLARHLASTRTEVIKEALRLLARREKIPMPKPGELDDLEC